MQRKWVAIALAILLVSIWSVFLSCSKKQSGPTGSDSTPVLLQVSPAHGAPGAPLEITGYTINPTDTGLMMFIGGYPAPFLADSNSINALVPLFMDSGAIWPAVPAGKQDVFIIKGNDTVAQALGALMIDSLPNADGATQAIVGDMQIISQSLTTIYNALPQLPGEDERLGGYRLAFAFMLDSLIAGTDSSLQSILSGTSSWTTQDTAGLGLQDAIMASSGALTYYNDFAGSVGQFSRKAVASANSIFCRGGGPDMDLACEMQIFVLLDDYKNYVVEPTAQTYNQSVKLGADLIALTGLAARQIEVINALMQVWEFVYGTLAPSLFPAEVTAFTLTLDSDTIGVNEPTYSTITVSARNHPATIKATDVLDALIQALGLSKAPPEIAAEFREILKETIKFAIGLYRECLVAYNDAHGGSVFIDPEADLPSLTWGPIDINHSDLMEMFSSEPDILASDTTILEWIGKKKGEGNIWAQARGAGEQSKVLIDYRLCAICVYSGGAFGNDLPSTEHETVTVGRAASLNVIVSGLPDNTNGSVYVDGPNGYSSGEIYDDTTLSKLEPGSYHIYAFSVGDILNHEYQPLPVDTTVDLAEDDSLSVEIHYETEGSLLVTVSGLPEGVEADIDVNGPDGYSAHLVADSLLDSLKTGSYTVVAHNVVDTSSQETLSADPSSQQIDVIGAQTATADVVYSGGVSLDFTVGNLNDGVQTVEGSSMAVFTQYPPAVDDTLRDTAYATHPLIECSGSDLAGGDTEYSISTNSSIWGSNATGTMIGSGGNNSASINIHINSTSSVGSIDTTTQRMGSLASTTVGTSYIYISVKNLSSDTRYFQAHMDVSGQAITDPPGGHSGGVGVTICGMSWVKYSDHCPTVDDPAFFVNVFNASFNPYDTLQGHYDSYPQPIPAGTTVYFRIRPYASGSSACTYSNSQYPYPDVITSGSIDVDVNYTFEILPLQ